MHNAGGPPAGPFLSITDAQWQKAFEQNLMSYIRLVQAAVPELKKAGGGRILTIASSSIKQPVPGLVTSNTLRTGIWGLAKTLAKELGPDNILVNVVAPGRIQTERIDELDQATATRRGVDVEQVKRESVGAIPLGRIGTPDEFASLARVPRLRRRALHHRPGDHGGRRGHDCSLAARGWRLATGESRCHAVRDRRARRGDDKHWSHEASPRSVASSRSR